MKIEKLLSLNFVESGFMMTSLDFKIQDGKLITNVYFGHPNFGKISKKVLTPDEINSIIDLLNQIRVLNWTEDYWDNGILDGVQWKLELHYNSNELISTNGSNQFPKGFNKLLNKLKVVAGVRNLTH